MWFPLNLDLASSKVTFVLADRETLTAQAFLEEDRWNTHALPHADIDLEDLIAAAASAPSTKPKVNFIWHTAFCCLTLLSQVLDFPGRNFSLREPSILMALAVAKRAGQTAPGKRHVWLPQAVFQLLDQPFQPGAKVTVKPANAANTPERCGPADIGKDAVSVFRLPAAF